MFGVTVSDRIAAGLSVPSLHLKITMTFFHQPAELNRGRTVKAKYELLSRSHALALITDSTDRL